MNTVAITKRVVLFVAASSLGIYAGCAHKSSETTASSAPPAASSASASQTAASSTAAPAAMAAMALPVTATFEKNAASTTEGPYVLTLNNTSDKPVTVSVHVDSDVTSHNRPKSRDVGPQEIAAGQSWKVDDLAAEDKVTVSAPGFEAQKLTVH